jgi:hypothetical protein
MKHQSSILLSTLALALSLSATASGAEHVKRNVSYSHCAMPDGLLNRSFAEYFESTANIFEGTVIETGKVPNKPWPAANQCWLKIKVDRWYHSNVNLPEVEALFDTDPSYIPMQFQGETYCPVKRGAEILVFGDQYKKESGTGNTGFYLHRGCSLVIPLQNAQPLQRLLAEWVVNRGEQK